jgi:hypothetical protein
MRDLTMVVSTERKAKNVRIYRMHNFRINAPASVHRFPMDRLNHYLTVDFRNYNPSAFLVRH